ncbi:MAG TPA: DUF3192 domain-containing protein [Burkholderiales bacterium]|nr:DUF3192 domain-containing protein [Burkholderiales bacterium]
MGIWKTLIVGAGVLAGCSTLVIDSVEQLRENNKKNIAQLAVGAPRAQVEKLLGDATAGGKLGDMVFGRLQHFAVTNPQRVESVTGPDGTAYDVLFYYTDLKVRDDKITDDELTPIVLRDGKVVGIGYRFLGERVPKYRGYQ